MQIKLRNSDLINGLAIRAVHQNDGSAMSRCFLENVEIEKGAFAPKDLAPRMLHYQFKMAQSLGIDRVNATAAGSAEGIASGKDKRTGFSRWPQLGFDAPLAQDEIEALPRHLTGCESLNDLMLRDGGFEYWKKVGSGRTVDFDLNPDSDSWLIFNLYLEKKNIRTK